MAAELARSVGRFDWWNIKAEHTPAEWAAQCAMYEVAPFGERRADYRMAVATANLMRMQTSGEVGDDEFAETLSALANYLPTSDVDDDEADMQALKNMQKE